MKGAIIKLEEILSSLVQQGFNIYINKPNKCSQMKVWEYAKKHERC